MPAWLEPVLSWTFIIGMACWLIYAGLVKPVINPIKTTTQTGGVSYTTNVSPFSCARIPSPETPVEKVTDVIANKVTH